MTTKCRVQMIQDLLQLLPFSELQVQQIFQEIKGYKEGTYKLGAKLPWHYITRPALYVHILHFRHHILVRLICTGEKTVEFTFEQETGKLLDSARQLVTVWPITNDSELSLNIKYAHSLLVRYGVNPKRCKND